MDFFYFMIVFVVGLFIGHKTGAERGREQGFEEGYDEAQDEKEREPFDWHDVDGWEAIEAAEAEIDDRLNTKIEGLRKKI